MTHNIQHQTLFSHAKLNKRRYYPGLFFQAVVNTEDGSYEYEIEADTFAEAAAQAEDMANSLMEDIIYIEVYQLG